MIAVSYLKSNCSKSETIKMINESIADLIHVDLMDGKYVENNNFKIDEVLNDLKDVNKPLDIHLMVNNPEEYIRQLAMLKPMIITIHLNSTSNFESTLELIKEYNIKVGIAINPDEDIRLLDKYLDKIDYVLIMSVYPGKGGQTFIKEVLDKVRYLNNREVLLGIDGGINDNTVNYLKNYNFDIVVSGSYVCMSNDYNKMIQNLKNVL